jgi:hypothetical protein
MKHEMHPALAVMFGGKNADEHGDDDESVELEHMSALIDAIKSGDEKEALSCFTDLVALVSKDEEEGEGDEEEHGA